MNIKANDESNNKIRSAGYNNKWLKLQIHKTRTLNMGFVALKGLCSRVIRWEKKKQPPNPQSDIWGWPKSNLLSKTLLFDTEILGKSTFFFISLSFTYHGTCNENNKVTQY